MFLTDTEISELCSGDFGLTSLITPYIPNLVSRIFVPRSNPMEKAEEIKAMSYGQSSCGYDIRLSTEFLYPKHVIENFQPVPILDPKGNREKEVFDYFTYDKRFVLDPGEMILGHSIETFNMIDDIGAIAVSKSSYARVGIFANITPLEPGWRGTLTIEIANIGHRPAYVYPKEGIAQLMFFRLKMMPKTTYADRNGKYQNQTEPTPAR